MRSIFLLLFLINAINVNGQCNSSHFQHNYGLPNDLKGNVKKIKESHFSLKKLPNGSVVKKQTNTIVSYFDSLIREVAQYNYESNSSLCYRDTIVYDSTGIEVLWEKLKPNGNVHFVYERFGDEQTANFYKDDGTLSSSILVKYGKDCRELETYFMHSDPQDNFKVINDYNEKGEITKSIVFKANNELFYEEYFTYDSVGNEITSIIMIGGEVSSKTFKKYTRGNNLLTFSKIDPSNINSNELYSMQYKFDNKGNWIRKIITVNGKPNSEVNRIIEYYSN
jgi:hypothetical protein